ncbi:MAG: hypothetical protein IKM20_07140 [Erysipelotrichales bacterium]|nr:hypothetical protein [Erysipelotrichales bacterium]
MSNKRKWTVEEVEDWYKKKGMLVYYNPSDLNMIVKKSWGNGYTVNWANPKAYLLQGTIIVIALTAIYLLK